MSKASFVHLFAHYDFTWYVTAINGQQHYWNYSLTKAASIHPLVHKQYYVKVYSLTYLKVVQHTVVCKMTWKKGKGNSKEDEWSALFVYLINIYLLPCLKLFLPSCGMLNQFYNQIWIRTAYFFTWHLLPSRKTHYKSSTCQWSKAVCNNILLCPNRFIVSQEGSKSECKMHCWYFSRFCLF